MKENNIILEKSFQFAIKIVELSKKLDELHLYALSGQVLRAGTSIGANITEAQQAQSRKDFISKLSIALKEASETNYWICLLKETGYIDESVYNTLINECKELERILTSIIKSTKSI